MTTLRQPVPASATAVPPAANSSISLIVESLRPALVLFIVLSLLTGLAYPLLISGVVGLVFPEQAAGSLLRDAGGKPIGSRLIGQHFSDPGHFWSRPSATSPMPNNAGASSGSNLGPLNPALIDAVKARVDALKVADPGNAMPIPVDLVTASASGVDPDLSVAAALYQAPRIARERHRPLAQIQALIGHHTESRVLGFLGEPRVNVLELNLALDATLPAGAH